MFFFFNRESSFIWHCNHEILCYDKLQFQRVIIYTTYELLIFKSIKNKLKCLIQMYTGDHLMFDGSNGTEKIEPQYHIVGLPADYSGRDPACQFRRHETWV